MKAHFIVAAAWLALPMVSADAATYAFDGSIERNDPDDWGGLVTNDFIKIEVVSPGAVTLRTTSDPALGLSFALYSTHRRDGDLRFDYIPLEISEAGGISQKQGSVAAGSYWIVLTAGISEWDREDIRGTSTADGGPGVGFGSYHLDIEGDFSVTTIYEGSLPNSVLEPGVAWLGVLGALAVWRRRRGVRKDSGAFQWLYVTDAACRRCFQKRDSAFSSTATTTGRFTCM